MERLLDEHLEKLKTRVIKMCSLVDEQFQLLLNLLKKKTLNLLIW